MAAPALGSWPLRICLALAGSVLSSLQLAVLLARPIRGAVGWSGCMPACSWAWGFW
ncbi:hypothetical protein [Pseudomonas rhodesiae]|uniref:hypothetical protein n=1 Tax=Pseudomonas rhodesiae TaxID=76760 RepID=UPI001CA4210D|nr:hypothetical protein [Pseudomonas rhodesiae]